MSGNKKYSHFLILVKLGAVYLHALPKWCFVIRENIFNLGCWWKRTCAIEIWSYHLRLTQKQMKLSWNFLCRNCKTQIDKKATLLLWTEEESIVMLNLAVRTKRGQFKIETKTFIENDMNVLKWSRREIIFYLCTTNLVQMIRIWGLKMVKLFAWEAFEENFWFSSLVTQRCPRTEAKTTIKSTIWNFSENTDSDNISNDGTKQSIFEISNFVRISSRSRFWTKKDLHLLFFFSESLSHGFQEYKTA